MRNAILAAGRWALLPLAMNAQADWSGFNRYAAIAEMQIDGGRIAVDLRITDKGWAKLAQASPSTPPEQAATQLLSVHCPGTTRLEPTLGAFQRVQANGQPTEPYYEVMWSYPLDGCGARLDVQPRAGLTKDNLGLIVLHRSVPVSDLVALEKPLTLTLDPADPWRSRFDDPGLIRRHAEPRSYVYVEPYEVRHEVLIRLADVIGHLETGLKNPQQVSTEERPALKQKIGQYLLGKNPVTVGGEALKPLLDRVEFVQFSRSGMVAVDEAQNLDVRTALVGAVIVHLTEQPAQRVDLRWDLFGPESGNRAVSVILGKESFEGYMTRTEPTFSWSREDSLDPAPSAEAPENTVTSASGKLTDQTLPAVLQTLLHNAYRAFQLREEEAVYDRLAKSLDDPLLESIYLQQRRSQMQQAKGLGGEGRVERIEILQTKLAESAGRSWWQTLTDATGTSPEVEVEASWKALGEVSHWGHGHQRENLYRARLSLRRHEPGAWKIASLRFEDGQRLERVASR
jgi:DNA-binding protein Fis